MKIKTSRILGKIIVLSLVTVTMTYGSNKENLSDLNDKSYTTLENSYQSMSTAQLQKEVEKRSINGDLTFAMGLELMKRWTNG
ncbi:MAG: hypothetical protein HKP62_07525 [Sulfurovum sp.]|nr:hypothetical protein [Sulfurovum sp.]MBT8349276.1 hypothetical protein [Sulfurovum sp.]NNJ45850.1 hypothetical protein [Sulfurovum sp.]